MENPEKLRSCLKSDDGPLTPHHNVCSTPSTPKRVTFAALNEVREFTPTFTDESTDSILSPSTVDGTLASPTTPEMSASAHDISPAEEIDFDPISMTPIKSETSSADFEVGIEDMTAGTLNDTSDDFVCSILNSVDMSMTFVSETDDGPKDEPEIEESCRSDLVPDICDEPRVTARSPSASPGKEIPPPPSSCENRDGIWKKFRITSPFSEKPRPRIQIRAIDAPPIVIKSLASTAVTQTSPCIGSVGSTCGVLEPLQPLNTETITKVASSSSLKESTLPFSSDDDENNANNNNEECEPAAKIPRPSFPNNIPTFKSFGTFKKETKKDPMKKIAGSKIKKQTAAKKKNQHWKSHLGSLVERLRSVGIEYDDYCCPQDLSPPRIFRRPDTASPQRDDDLIVCLHNKTRRSKIPRPVDFKGFDDISNSGDDDQHYTSSLVASRSATNASNKETSVVKSAIAKEISAIKNLHGVPKVRKLELLSKEYLRHVDDETFDWAVAQLTGYVYPEFLKAENEHRRIRKLIQESPKFGTEQDSSDPLRVFAKLKTEEMRKQWSSD